VINDPVGMVGKKLGLGENKQVGPQSVFPALSVACRFRGRRHAARRGREAITRDPVINSVRYRTHLIHKYSNT